MTSTHSSPAVPHTPLHASSNTWSSEWDMAEDCDVVALADSDHTGHSFVPEGEIGAEYRAMKEAARREEEAAEARQAAAAEPSSFRQRVASQFHQARERFDCACLRARVPPKLARGYVLALVLMLALSLAARMTPDGAAVSTVTGGPAANLRPHLGPSADEVLRRRREVASEASRLAAERKLSLARLEVSQIGAEKAALVREYERSLADVRGQLHHAQAAHEKLAAGAKAAAAAKAKAPKDSASGHGERQKCPPRPSTPSFMDSVRVAGGKVGIWARATTASAKEGATRGAETLKKEGPKLATTIAREGPKFAREVLSESATISLLSGVAKEGAQLAKEGAERIGKASATIAKEVAKEAPPLFAAASEAAGGVKREVCATASRWGQWLAREVKASSCDFPASG